MSTKPTQAQLYSASDTRDIISKQYPSHKEISGVSTKQTQAQLYQHQIPEKIIR